MARKKQETLVLFKDVLNVTRMLSDAQFGALMRAAFGYRFAGEEYTGDDCLVEMAFLMLEGQIDRYMEACDTNAKNARREEREAAPVREEITEEPQEEPVREVPVETEESEGERNAAECGQTPQNAPHTHTRNHTHNHNHSHTHNRSQDAGNEKAVLPPSFSPPSVEEVRQYAKESNIEFDSERFVNYYAANDWRLGAAKMRDWKLAVRIWSGFPVPDNP